MHIVVQLLNENCELSAWSGDRQRSRWIQTSQRSARDFFLFNEDCTLLKSNSGSRSLQLIIMKLKNVISHALGFY
jgi:hypothetical protein